MGADPEWWVDENGVPGARGIDISGRSSQLDAASVADVAHSSARLFGDPDVTKVQTDPSRTICARFARKKSGLSPPSGA